ncbi:MAG: hypothetical protein ACE5G2_04490 [Candidatus Krumholzibacteriia bacterium]
MLSLVLLLLLAGLPLCARAGDALDDPRRPAQAGEPQAPEAQAGEAADPASALDLLVQQAVHLVGDRYSRPLGRVVERRRGRVFVSLRGEQPKKGVRYLAMRPIEDAAPGRERLITKLQVQRITAGLVECKESDRAGKAHAEPGDVVRPITNPPRVLLAPCLALVDLAPVIPQVVGEKLRTAMLGRMDLELAGDLETERSAEAAYWSGNVVGFLRAQKKLDFVLYPVLLQTSGKLLLNLEYYSVERERATDIDVAAVELDAMLSAWLRAGRPRRVAPSGFRLLAAQVFPWPVRALAGAPHGGIFAVTRDSVHVLDFYYPGLRPGATLDLVVREQVRREPYSVVLGSEALHATLDDAPHRNATYVLSDERWPRTFISSVEGRKLRLSRRAVRTQVAEVFRELWIATRGPSHLASRWWPAPGWSRAVVNPLFADLDSDGKLDLIWSDERGTLHVRRVAARNFESFAGFGDVKAVQPSDGPQSHTVLWLTDPVWEGGADRLHAAQLVGRKLEVVWSSEPFEGTLVALVSADLNGDEAYDLVVGEDVEGGTRLHLFLALPGERTAARGMALETQRGP